MQLSIYLSATFLLDRVGKRVFLRVTSAKPTITPRNLRCLVGSSGLEPPTSRLSGVCSNQLSYEPIMVEVSGFEPLTPCLQGRCYTS